MLFLRNFPRFFHTTTSTFSAEKSALAALRKKTGYTFANCKKALEMHNNDLTKAEEWLRQQAQALGWSKATKLEGRQTTQGLIGVTVHDQEGVMIEVNCETDFVARNVEFQNMVREATEVCLKYLKETPNGPTNLAKVTLDANKLKSLVSSDGKTLADKLALMIGTVGENATLKRAIGIKVNEGIHLSGYAHPSGKALDSVLIGRIGGLIAVRNHGEETPQLAEVAKGLVQHIVGMAPKAIGNAHDKPADNKEDESDLIHQEYLLDDTFTIKEILDLNQVEVLDFQRFECGEFRDVSEAPLKEAKSFQ